LFIEDELKLRLLTSIILIKALKHQC